jgi:hypothetical protein
LHHIDHPLASSELHVPEFSRSEKMKTAALVELAVDRVANDEATSIFGEPEFSPDLDGIRRRIRLSPTDLIELEATSPGHPVGRKTLPIGSQGCPLGIDPRCPADLNRPDC